MGSSLKLLRTLQAAMLGTVLFCAFLAAQFGPGPRNTVPIVRQALGVAGVLITVGIFAVRRTLVIPAENLLGGNAVDPGALLRWRAGYIIILALAETVAVHGLVLRFVGFGFSQVLPFFLASFILMIFFGPRRPPNAVG